MKILIVESEIYLAQSISVKLSDQGFSCEVCATVNEAQAKETTFDIVLLSTNISGQNFYPIIERYKASIVILMISYISSDTVANPLKAGAKDYILKPFMIDELLRKIEHYVEFEKLKIRNKMLDRYISYRLKDINLDIDIPKKHKFPIFLKTNYQKCADKYFFEYINTNSVSADIVFLDDENLASKVSSLKRDTLVYAIGYEELKKSEKKECEEIFAKRYAIFPIGDIDEELPFEVFEIKIDSNSVDISGEILSIDDYVKLIITKYENKYPDTELSRKLGMSRKSLWEKRKKYGISKKK